MNLEEEIKELKEKVAVLEKKHAVLDAFTYLTIPQLRERITALEDFKLECSLRGHTHLKYYDIVSAGELEGVVRELIQVEINHYTEMIDEALKTWQPENPQILDLKRRVRDWEELLARLDVVMPRQGSAQTPHGYEIEKAEQKICTNAFGRVIGTVNKEMIENTKPSPSFECKECPFYKDMAGVYGERNFCEKGFHIDRIGGRKGYCITHTEPTCKECDGYVPLDNVKVGEPNSCWKCGKDFTKPEPTEHIPQVQCVCPDCEKEREPTESLQDVPPDPKYCIRMGGNCRGKCVSYIGNMCDIILNAPPSYTCYACGEPYIPEEGCLRCNNIGHEDCVPKKELRALLDELKVMDRKQIREALEGLLK